LSYLVEILKNFKSIEPQDIEKLHKYYEAFFKIRKFPRFFQNILTLGNYTNIPKYYFGELEDCLCIFKKQYIYQSIIYLLLPSISLTNDIVMEKYLIDWFNNEGVKTLLSEEDIVIYNYSKNDLTLMKDNFEFIYDSSLFVKDIFEIKNSDYQKVRYFINQFKKSEDKLSIYGCNNKYLNETYYNKMNDLYLFWKDQKGKSIETHNKIIKKFKDLHCCKKNYKKGNKTILENLGNIFKIVFGDSIYANMLESVKQQKDYEFEVTEEFMNHYEKEYKMQQEGKRLNEEMLKSFKLEIYTEKLEKLTIHTISFNNIMLRK